MSTEIAKNRRERRDVAGAPTHPNATRHRTSNRTSRTDRSPREDHPAPPTRPRKPSFQRTRPDRHTPERRPPASQPDQNPTMQSPPQQTPRQIATHPTVTRPPPKRLSVLCGPQRPLRSPFLKRPPTFTFPEDPIPQTKPPINQQPRPRHVQPTTAHPRREQPRSGHRSSPWPSQTGSPTQPSPPIPQITAPRTPKPRRTDNRRMCPDKKMSAENAEDRRERQDVAGANTINESRPKSDQQTVVVYVPIPARRPSRARKHDRAKPSFQHPRPDQHATERRPGIKTRPRPD